MSNVLLGMFRKIGVPLFLNACCVARFACRRQQFFGRLLEVIVGLGLGRSYRRMVRREVSFVRGSILCSWIEFTEGRSAHYFDKNFNIEDSYPLHKVRLVLLSS